MEDYDRDENADVMVVCPFDPYHVMLRKRLTTHITKCSRKPEHSHFKKCPFNAEHWVTEDQFKHHVEKCKNRECVDRFLVQETERLQGNCSVPPYEDHFENRAGNLDDDDEDWEAEGVEVSSGNFLEKLPGNRMQQPIFKKVQEWQPAQRRNYYQKQVEKAREARERGGHRDSEVDTNLSSNYQALFVDLPEEPLLSTGPPSTSSESTRSIFQDEVKPHERELMSLSVGRGQSGVGRGSRIAARIYGNQQASTSSSVSHPNSAASNSPLRQGDMIRKMAIGRGRGDSHQPFDLTDMNQSIANIHNSYSAAILRGKSSKK